MLPERMPRPRSDVVFRQLEDELVLVDLATNRIYSLNSTGARFWQHLADGLDGTAIQSRLVEEFDVEAAVVEQEMGAMLRLLESERLVE